MWMEEKVDIVGHLLVEIHSVDYHQFQSSLYAEGFWKAQAGMVRWRQISFQLPALLYKGRQYPEIDKVESYYTCTSQSTLFSTPSWVSTSDLSVTAWSWERASLWESVRVSKSDIKQCRPMGPAASLDVRVMMSFRWACRWCNLASVTIQRTYSLQVARLLSLQGIHAHYTWFTYWIMGQTIETLEMKLLSV